MKRETNHAESTVYERLQDHVARGSRVSLEGLLDTITSNESAIVDTIRFNKKSVSIKLQWPFWLPPPSDNPGDYLGTMKDLTDFRRGLRKQLSGRDAGRHLSSALYGELREFLIVFTKAHRWGERVVQKLNSIGERRMAGRRSTTAIERQEGRKILRQAQMIQSTISEINKRAKSLKSRGPVLRRKILKDYGRDKHPWIRSLFPALRDLHGKPTLDNLNPQTIRKLVKAIIQKESYRETGTLHSLGAIDQVLRRQ